MAGIDADRRPRIRGSALQRRGGSCDGGKGEKTATVEGYGSASFARGYSSPGPAGPCGNEAFAAGRSISWTAYRVNAATTGEIPDAKCWRDMLQLARLGIHSQLMLGACQMTAAVQCALAILLLTSLVWPSPAKALSPGTWEVRCLSSTSTVGDFDSYKIKMDMVDMLAFERSYGAIISGVRLDNGKRVMLLNANCSFVQIK
jgi:hypothetical protein